MTIWKTIGKGMYIDIESITETSDNIYEFWVKITTDYQSFKQMFSSNLSQISYSISKYILNISNKTYSIKQVIVYDKNGQIFGNIKKDSKNLEWDDILPDTISEIGYEIITNKSYIMEQLNEYSDTNNKSNVSNNILIKIIAFPLRFLFSLSSPLMFLFALGSIISLFTGEFKNFIFLLVWTITVAIFNFILYAIMKALKIEIIKKN